MPTYQYRCIDCGRDLEVVQKFSDATLTECPTCTGTLRKVFNAVGVVFKGSGFYRTDSRAAAGREVTAESNGSDTKADKTSDAPGDKPAEPKPAKVDSSTSTSDTSGSNGSGVTGSGSNRSGSNRSGSKGSSSNGSGSNGSGFKKRGSQTSGQRASGGSGSSSTGSKAAAR